MSHRHKQKQRKKQNPSKHKHQKEPRCPVCGERGHPYALPDDAELRATFDEEGWQSESEPADELLIEKILIEHVCPECGTDLEPISEGPSQNGGLCPTCMKVHFITVETGRAVR